MSNWKQRGERLIYRKWHDVDRSLHENGINDVVLKISLMTFVMIRITTAGSSKGLIPLCWLTSENCI